jgi:hypothetical protein
MATKGHVAQATPFCIMQPDWIIIKELLSCYPSGDWNTYVAATVLEETVQRRGSFRPKSKII